MQWNLLSRSNLHLLIPQVTFIFGSLDTGVAGSHVWHFPSFLFQYQPSRRFQRHFVRRFPVAICPGKHRIAHVAPLHIRPSRPGMFDVSIGAQSDQWRDWPSPSTFPTPTGAPQLWPDFCVHICWTSEKVGWSHSPAITPDNNAFQGWLIVNHVRRTEKFLFNFLTNPKLSFIIRRSNFSSKFCFLEISRILARLRKIRKRDKKGHRINSSKLIDSIWCQKRQKLYYFDEFSWKIAGTR